MTEVERKLGLVREIMSRNGLNAVRLRGVDWFSWITGGGSNVVILTSETGIAQVLVTATQAFVLTDEIEHERLASEELRYPFEIVSSRWSEREALDVIVRELAGQSRVASDRPEGLEQDLPLELRHARLQLDPEESLRYHALGLDAAQAMREALSLARPEWSEADLAGEGARALWRRGIHPTLVLAAGEDRLMKYRHPFPTLQPLGQKAMMVFCARRHGLYANLSRIVFFKEMNPMDQQSFRLLTEIESVALEHSRPGMPLDSIFEAITKAYQERYLSEQIEKQHFGGLTGYLSREAFARPVTAGESRWIITNGSAVAWNPTLTGMKIEDTFLVGEHELLNLTRDPEWPSVNVDGRERPAIMVRP